LQSRDCGLNPAAADRRRMNVDWDNMAKAEREFVGSPVKVL
jgi:hypothetical protein